ncbi:MAG: hypothetical protein CMJ58_05565 [Planctomycetaceae bacterium]|nr:hypothetical protein [Planctomycetaceae bacterium]
MKYRVWIWLFIGAIPLAIYPFVLMASAMSLAGHPTDQPQPFLLRFTSQGFLWSSILYAPVFLWCGKKTRWLLGVGDDKKALLAAVLPLFYLTIVAAFFCGWMICSQ